MGTGYRSMFRGAPIFRGAAAWLACALLLSGCETIQEHELWPFDADQASGEGAATPDAGGERPASTQGDEVALDPSLVTKVQTRLDELGYKPGPVDGLMGPQTRDALRRYQVVVGLPVDGRVTRPVLARLIGSTEAVAPAPAEDATASDDAPPAGGADGAALGPPPSYEAGSRYVYADGEVQTVLSVDGEQVYWGSSQNGHSVARSNFLVPSLSWVTSETSGKRTIDAAAADLWPDDGGEEIAFSATAVVEHKTRPDGESVLNETWRCRVGEAAEVAVRAGAFQTRRIACEGVSEPDGASLQRIWHYAPEIGHYVLYEEIDASQDTRRKSELLAVVPSTVAWPPVARAGLGWALSHALETAEPGERTIWTSSAVEVEVAIEPGAVVASDDDQTCRNFVQIWSEPGRTRVYPGLSCRAPSGQWLIPGLEAGVALAKGDE